MHEHYEDCPWREQALYTMDSRNQMLCGYYAFGEYDFPKACLRLISKEKREDSLLSICFPAGTELTIPSFGFHFFTEVYEYYKYSNDLSFIKELFPRMQSLINAYISYVNLDGLLYTFEGDLYWNFYEWADGLEGCLGKTENKRVDLILNCLFSIALSKMSYFCNLLNFENDYFDMANKTNEKIKAMFYNKSKKAFSMYADVELFSELGNSLAVLCGAANEDISNELCDKLVEETRWTPITLSMKCFKYDALLKINKDKYKDYIISDIKKVYQPMIENGNTVWETIKGQSDFNNAGSLCHGWSALPVYYFNILK